MTEINFKIKKIKIGEDDADQFIIFLGKDPVGNCCFSPSFVKKEYKEVLETQFTVLIRHLIDQLRHLPTEERDKILFGENNEIKSN